MTKSSDFSLTEWIVRHGRFVKKIFTVSRVGDSQPERLVLKMVKDKLIIAVIPRAIEPAEIVKSLKMQARKVEKMTNEWSNCMDGHGISLWGRGGSLNYQ